MKTIFLPFAFLPYMAFAQVDTVTTGVVVGNNSSLNTLVKRSNHSIDTLPASLREVDSIRTKFVQHAHLIQKEYLMALEPIKSETGRVTSTIDSLKRLDLRTSKYRKKLDSLDGLRKSTDTNLTLKLDSLKWKTIGKINALHLPPEYKEPLQEFTKEINQISLNVGKINLPELKVSGYSLPEVDGISNLTDKVANIATIDPGKLQDISTSVGDLSNVTDQVQGYQNEIKNIAPDELGQVTGQAQAYQEDIKSISQGSLHGVKKIPETLESQASKIDGMDELEKQSGIIDGHKTKLDDFKDLGKGKEKVMEVTKKAAVDHFAGKHEQLKAAMEKLSKYKQKYSSVSSIKDLPKRPLNPMKGKLFIERLVPGLFLQYQQKNSYLIDVNPYLGYRISGRFISGLGWNHRYAYDKDSHSFSSRARIFGPRAYVDFKLGKGFIAHLEGETMNSFVPSTLRGSPDTGEREWVSSFMTGIKKEYRIYKNLKGTALIQYNLFNRYYKAPYVDRLNSRIGFEYVLKKKVRK